MTSLSPLEGEGREVACGAAQWRGKEPVLLRGELGNWTMRPLAVGTLWAWASQGTETLKKLRAGMCLEEEAYLGYKEGDPWRELEMTTGYRGSVGELGGSFPEGVSA